MNSLLLFILGLSAFTCLAQLIRQRRQVTLCRILAGLIALGLLAFILAEENQSPPAPPPLEDSFSIIAPGGQGEFDRLQIVLRDCFGLLVAREIAVSAKTQVVTVPLGKLGKEYWAVNGKTGYCSISLAGLTRVYSSWGMLIGGKPDRWASRHPDHQWQARCPLVGSDIIANKVQIYYRPFHSKAITGSQNLGELMASLPEIPEYSYMPREHDSSIWAQINGTRDRLPWAQLPVKEIVFAALFLCLALPWRFPLTFPLTLALILGSLVMLEKIRISSSIVDFAQNQPMPKRINALRELNLSRFHGLPIIRNSDRTWYEKYESWSIHVTIDPDDPITKTSEYQEYWNLISTIQSHKRFAEYDPR